MRALGITIFLSKKVNKVMLVMVMIFL